MPHSDNDIDDLTSEIELKSKTEIKKEMHQLQDFAQSLLETDLEPIHQAIDVMANKHQQATAKFERLETFRDQLIEQGNEAVEALLAEFEQMERQKLKQLVRHAAKEKKAEKPGKHYKNLFTYLKENS